METCRCKLFFYNECFNKNASRSGEFNVVAYSVAGGAQRGDQTVCASPGSPLRDELSIRIGRAIYLRLNAPGVEAMWYGLAGGSTDC